MRCVGGQSSRIEIWKPTAHYLVQGIGRLAPGLLTSASIEGDAVWSSEQWFWICRHNPQLKDLARVPLQLWTQILEFELQLPSHKVIIECNTICSAERSNQGWVPTSPSILPPSPLIVVHNAQSSRSSSISSKLVKIIAQSPLHPRIFKFSLQPLG